MTEQRVTINRHDARNDVSHYVIADPHLVEDIFIAGVFGTVRQHRRSCSNKIGSRDSAGSGECTEYVSGEHHKGGASIEHERQYHGSVYLN